MSDADPGQTSCGSIARLRAFTSEVIPNYPLPFRDRRHCELYLSGLRLAAGDTT